MTDERIAHGVALLIWVLIGVAAGVGVTALALQFLTGRVV